MPPEPLVSNCSMLTRLPSLSWRYLDVLKDCQYPIGMASLYDPSPFAVTVVGAICMPLYTFIRSSPSKYQEPACWRRGLWGWGGKSGSWCLTFVLAWWTDGHIQAIIDLVWGQWAHGADNISSPALASWTVSTACKPQQVIEAWCLIWWIPCLNFMGYRWGTSVHPVSWLTKKISQTFISDLHSMKSSITWLGGRWIWGDKSWYLVVSQQATWNVGSIVPLGSKNWRRWILTLIGSGYKRIGFTSKYVELSVPVMKPCTGSAVCTTAYFNSADEALKQPCHLVPTQDLKCTSDFWSCQS